MINLTLQEKIQFQASIRSELPGLLSQLVDLGKVDDALRLLCAWGTRSLANSEIWKEAKHLLGD